jgi:hypothetical protein
MSQGFDLRVHHIDPKTGRVNRVDPYRLIIDKEHGRRFERPPGSKCYYSENGELLDSPELQAQREAKAKAEAEARAAAALAAQAPAPVAPVAPAKVDPPADKKANIKANASEESLGVK